MPNRRINCALASPCFSDLLIQTRTDENTIWKFLIHLLMNIAPLSDLGHVKLAIQAVSS